MPAKPHFISEVEDRSSFRSMTGTGCCRAYSMTTTKWILVNSCDALSDRMDVLLCCGAHLGLRNTAATRVIRSPKQDTLQQLDIRKASRRTAATCLRWRDEEPQHARLATLDTRVTQNLHTLSSYLLGCDSH